MMEQDNQCQGLKQNWIWVISGCILLLGGGALRLLAGNAAGFADWYGESIYPILEGLIGRIAGYFPFSLSETGIYIGILAFVIYMVRFWHQPVRVVSRTVGIIGLLFFSYMTCCGVNYYRTPFSVYAGLVPKASSAQDLKDLCRYLTEQVNGYESCAGKRLELGEYGNEGVKAMKNLGETYETLNGFYPRPKPLAVPWILSVQQLAGI